ncbi:hypothetical protein BV20DRAFT_1054060 [Pilatotrama ljubarskyi]|nr:hypothetical protein BV20DRAFT_1054060 [Pilatotrama ljubarskyi]
MHSRINEYHALTDEEKQKLVSDLMDNQTSHKFGQRLTERGRVADWEHSCNEMVRLSIGLKNRISVKVMILMMQNNTEYHSKPCWFFTNAHMDRFMRVLFRGWDCELITTKMEVFAVAGCDFANLHSTAKEKADYFKHEIRKKVRTMLCTITGNPKAIMHYAKHEKNIILRYGVELVGYCAEKFVNPSALSTSLPPLRLIIKAINDSECSFVCLTPAQLQAQQKTYDEKCKAGRSLLARSVATPHTHTAAGSASNIDGGESAPPPVKCRKSGTQGALAPSNDGQHENTAPRPKAKRAPRGNKASVPSHEGRGKDAALKPKAKRAPRNKKPTPTDV